jgi:hypothetical protein
MPETYANTVENKSKLESKMPFSNTHWKFKPYKVINVNNKSLELQTFLILKLLFYKVKFQAV